MKYLVYYEGVGEGCDYTIGCNLAIEFLEADSIVQAHKKLLDQLEYYADDLESALEPYAKITIFPVGLAFPLDLEEIRTQCRTAQKAKDDDRKEQEERALYERLKIRYEA